MANPRSELLRFLYSTIAEQPQSEASGTRSDSENRTRTACSLQRKQTHRFSYREQAASGCKSVVADSNEVSERHRRITRNLRNRQLAPSYRALRSRDNDLIMLRILDQKMPGADRSSTQLIYSVRNFALMKTVLLSAIALLLVLAACGPSQTPGTLPPSGDPAQKNNGVPAPVAPAPTQDVPDQQAQVPEPVVPPGAGQIQPTGQAASPKTVEINMTARDFEFTPSTITVHQGDRVILHLESLDVEHGFGIREYDINEQLPVGQPKTVEFVADKAGTFTFRCTVPCGEGHRDMAGTLVVQV
jgi:cytochrome c oxidase subunit II